MPANFNNLLEKINGFGRYQKICLSMVCIGSLLSGVASNIIVLVLKSPSYHQPVNCQEINKNLTLGKPINVAWNASVSTLVTEFNLICDDTKYINLIQTCYMVGSLLGCLILYLSDKYGRALTSFLSCLLMGLCYIILPLSGQLPFSKNTNMDKVLNGKTFTVYFYAFWNLMFGLSYRFQMMVAYIYILEITQQNRQSLSGACINSFFPFGTILMAILSIFVSDWRELMRIFGYLAVGYLPFRWFYFEKSPKYLLSSKSGEVGVRRCYVVMMKIAMKNKQAIENQNNSSLDLLPVTTKAEPFLEQLRQIKNSETDPRNTKLQAKNKNIFAFTIFFKNGYYMTRTTIIICYIWGVTYAIYMGQTLSLGDLPGGLTGSLIFAALSDLFACYIYEKLMDLPCLGRRGTLILANFIIGVCLILKSFVANFDFGFVFANFVVAPKFINILVLILAFTARIANYMVWCVIIQLSNEAYPTEFLATAIGFLNIMASFMAVSSPSVLFLKKYFDWLPSVVFGVASLVSCFLARYLPETLKSVENGLHKVVELITLEDAVDFYELQFGSI